MDVRKLFDLTGRVAVVTGGSMGLGLQFARALAELGANLVLCARKVDRCEQAAADLRQELGVKVLALRCDVTNPPEVQHLADRAVEEFGRIDILVNNAGISWCCPVEDLSLEQWNKVMSVNVTGTFLCTQAAGRIMIRQGKGKIINIASVAGLIGAAPEAMDSIVYSTSKGAVISFTRDMACKWAKHNILVNAIAPAWFPTRVTEWILDHRKDILLPNIPLGRFGSDHDLKGAVAFLASDASDYVTGQVLVVDGGSSAW
ncbi:MAG: SDR family oxidoreductase [Dethiobacter sp.]|jgi:gluconate 5-dehydrogenase|nr:SDR family oxidoreductase [Dethiobacter sp.]